MQRGVKKKTVLNDGVSFHPRPQIGTDLTREFKPHRNRDQCPNKNETLVLGRKFKSHPSTTRHDLKIANPTRFFT